MYALITLENFTLKGHFHFHFHFHFRFRTNVGKLPKFYLVLVLALVLKTGFGRSPVIRTAVTVLTHLISMVIVSCH